MTHLIFYTLISGLLFACNDNGKNMMNHGGHDDSEVLATVAGSHITQNDLDQTLLKMFGEFQLSLIQEDGLKKALDSLVASRAMALESEKSMDEESLAEINRKVAVYRENLLVSDYVKQNADVTPVSNEMVKTFYEKYPERYGAKTIRQYEMVLTSEKVTTKQRAAVVKAMTTLRDQQKWETAVGSTNNNNVKLKYRKGYTKEKLLTPKLRALLMNLELAKASNVTFVDGIPYMARILEEKSIPPQPLQQVSAEIRRALGPIQFKKAIKQVSEELMKKTKVVYAAGSEQ